jgi:tetratricopeptide (TPR) repeat protein
MKTLTIFACSTLFACQIFAQSPQQAPKNAHDESISAFIMASKYLKNQQYAEASMFLDKAITKDPTNHVFHYERGKCYLSLKNNEKALSCFRKVTELQSTNSEAYLMMGYIYANTHKIKEAISAYDLAFQYEESPASRLAQKLSILNLMDKNGWLKQADKHIQDAMALQIENPLLYYYDGKNKNMHHKYREAKESMLKAVATLDKTIVPTTTNDKPFEITVEKINAQNIEPTEQGKYYYELYTAYYHLNEYEAAQKLTPHLNIEPYKSQVKRMTTSHLYAIAYAHFMVYDLDKCKHVLDDILKKDKHNTPANQLLVKLSELKTDKSLIIKQLETAIANISDENKKSKLQQELLVLEVEKGEYEKATHIANQIIQAKPDNHTALFLKAICLDKLGRDAEAVQVLKNLVTFKNLDQKTLSEYEFELGLIAEKMNNVNLATEAFKHSTYLYFKAAAMEELQKVEHLGK